MKIIIVGCGNIGATLAEQLSIEGHDITVIDVRRKVVENITNSYDVLGIVGNGTSFSVQAEAGIEDADVLIAVTGADEINLLCCIIAKRTEKCHTIARISNPAYDRESHFIRQELGLSLVINPQKAAAREMVKLFQLPSALSVDTFSNNKVELVNYRIEEGNPLCDLKLCDLPQKLKCDVLIPTVERDEKVVIPDGNFELKKGDEISIVGTKDRMLTFFKKMKVSTSAVKDVMIAGAGRTGMYLANQLLDMGIHVKIIEKDQDLCDTLAETLPRAMVICGDCTDKNILLEEGLLETDAFVANMDIDEENIMLALYVKSVADTKLITKVHRISYDKIIDSLDLGSIVYPRFIAAEMILKYIRAMKSKSDSAVATLRLLGDNKAEAIEFLVSEDSKIVGVPLQELKLKPNVIIGCINHCGKALIANGQSVISVGDTVIVVTTDKGFSDIGDILR